MCRVSRQQASTRKMPMSVKKRKFDEYSRPVKRMMVSGNHPNDGLSGRKITKRSLERKQYQCKLVDIEYPPPAPHNTTGFILDNLEAHQPMTPNRSDTPSPVPEWPWLSPQESFIL